MNNDPLVEAYDKKTIALHWLGAILVFALWAAGQTIDWFPRGFPRTTVRSLHITFGVVFGLLLMYRIFWRQTGATQLPPLGESIWNRLAKYAHIFLYVLMTSIFLSGVVAVWYRGVNMFDLFRIPAFDQDNKYIRHLLVDIHEWIANGLLITAVIHTLFACWHHFKLKDGLLSRMSIARAVASEE